MGHVCKYYTKSKHKNKKLNFLADYMKILTECDERLPTNM